MTHCKINYVGCTCAAFKTTVESNKDNSGDKKKRKKRLWNRMSVETKSDLIIKTILTFSRTLLLPIKEHYKSFHEITTNGGNGIVKRKVKNYSVKFIKSTYILLINRERGHYREISDRGLDVFTER